MPVDVLLGTRGFVYPYTELAFDDVDRVTTNLFLFDSLSYLDYNSPEIGESALFYQLSPLRGEPNPDAEDCWQLLHHYTEDKMLLGVGPYDLRSRASPALDESRMLKIVQENVGILRDSGVVSKARMQGMKSYLLADEKLFPSLLKVVPHQPSESREGMTVVPWEWGEAILLAYTEIACREMQVSPVPLRGIHWESISAVLQRKSRESPGWVDPDGARRDSSAVVLSRLLEIHFATLRQTWTIPLATIRKLRRDTREIWKDALEGIARYLQDHITSLEGRNYVPPDPVAEDIVTELRELREEIAKSAAKENIGRANMVVSGLVGSAVGGFVTLALSSVLGAAALLPGIAAGGASAEAEYELAERIKRRAARETAKLKRDPLYGTLCFITELEKHL